MFLVGSLGSSQCSCANACMELVWWDRLEASAGGTVSPLCFWRIINGPQLWLADFSEVCKGNGGSEDDERMQLSNCRGNPWFVQVMTLSYISDQSKY